MSPFDKNYKSQIVLNAYEKQASELSRKCTARRERMMQSDDPKQRIAASGYIAGMGRVDPAIAEKIRKGFK